MKNKKKRILSGVLLIIAISFLLDCIFWYASPSSFVPNKAIALDAADTLCSGCDIENGIYKPWGDYGQLNFEADIPQAETVIIRFNRICPLLFIMLSAESDRSHWINR